MKRRVKELGLLLIFIFAGSFLFSKACQAASADVELSADKADITVGDRISVVIKVGSASYFGDFEANLTYDDSILEYAGGSAAVKGSSGFLRISDMDVLDGDKSRKYTLKFEALKVGICNIEFSGPVMVYDLNTGYEMSVSSNKLTLNVKAPETASKNAKLKSLKTSPTDISPAFSPDVYEYAASVGYDTKRLVITALAEDPKATVSIDGNDSLSEGENKVVISVLAESGDVIEYTINVFRDSMVGGTPSDTPDGSEVSPEPSQGTFEVVTVGGEKYAIYSGRYQLLEPDSSVAIPEGYKEATLILSGARVNAFVPENNEASDFLLIYAKNELGEIGFYQYDRIEKTLQRYNQEGAAIGTPEDQDPSRETDALREYSGKLQKAIIVIIILGSACGLLLFATIKLLLKLRSTKEEGK
ncbi:MAG TPA: hypothetical protein GXX75_09585 [Clostridiales bacterium]|nr:hypothetical protein [Clostridiales bacterium]